jgi:hypothetical protein
MPIEGRSSKGLIFLILQISKNVVEAMANSEWSSEERTNFEVEITTVVGATSRLMELVCKEGARLRHPIAKWAILSHGPFCR